MTWYLSKFDTSIISSTEGSRNVPYYPGVSDGNSNKYNVKAYGTYDKYSINYKTWLASSSKSGVTVSDGVDFYSRTTDELIYAGFTGTKLANYTAAIRKQGSSALDWLWTYQSTSHLTSSESRNLFNAVVRTVWLNVARKISNFSSLDSNIITAMMGIAWGGANKQVCIDSCTYVNNNDISGLITYIQNSSASSIAAKKAAIISYLQDYLNSVTTSDSSKSTKTKSTNSTTYIAIGNEFSPSEYTDSDSATSFLKTLFNNAGISSANIAILLKAVSLEGSDATSFISSYSSFALSETETDGLFIQWVKDARDKLINNFGIDLSAHPKEVNTALISYCLDKNLIDEDIQKEVIQPIQTKLKSKSYDDIATLIENDGADDLTRFNTRRTSEASLIRNRTSDSPNYSNSTTDSTNYDTFFTAESQSLSKAVAYARSTLYNLRGSSSSSTSSSDEIYSQVTSSTTSSFSDLLQKNQTITDSYTNSLELDYTKRLRIKTVYNTGTRSSNITYVALEKQYEDAGTQMERLSEEYDLIPYGSNLFKTTKLAAINRSKYRIKKYQYEINQKKASLMSYGIFDFDITLAELIAMIALDPTLLLIKLILTTLFEELLDKQTLLDLEKSNLNKLTAEYNRFNK